jgi:magnesium-transporting ATPase (P-type)
MYRENNIENRLWQYIDGLSAPQEKTAVEGLIQTNTAWKAKYEELLDIHSLLQSSVLEAPSMRFTKNVMEEISKLQVAPAAKKYLNNKIIWSIGIFFIIMLAGTLVYAFSQIVFNNNHESAIGKKLDKIDFSNFFNNSWMNALIMMNVVIGLFLLDNYLSSKRKKYQNQAY